MTVKTEIFDKKSDACSRGSMMVELLLSLALLAVALPFIFNFQKSRIDRAKDVAVAREMETVKSSLERYIEFHKKELMAPIGKNITRVKIADLEEYGIGGEYIKKHGDNFQIRILKSRAREGRVTLQGVIVLHNKDISPLRTRHIVNLGADQTGFVEKGKAFGAFGVWNANTSDMGIQGDEGIVKTTKTSMDQDQYLWRLPSENLSDARMLSALNLGKHDIIGAKFTDAMSAQFEEILKSQKIIADKIVFQSRTTIDKSFESTSATIMGTLSGDARSMEISNTLTLNDTAKFSNFTVNNLWVNNLNLSGLSISTENSNAAAILKVNQTMDMIGGHVAANYVTVGFTGSITPKLDVRTRIEDSTNPGYFWDASTKTAIFVDVSIAELNRMAALVLSRESGGKTTSNQLFGVPTANKNATAADFMNAVSEIQKRVRSKYEQLNLD